MANITPTGLVPVTLPEYKAKLEANYAEVPNTTFDLSSNSPDGQLIVNFAQGYYELDQLQIQTDINRDPNRAEDKALDDLLAHQNLTRRQDKNSVTTIPCYGNGLLTKGHQVKDNTTGLIWILNEDITLPANGQFECEIAGTNYPTTDLKINTPETYWEGIDPAISTSAGHEKETNAQARQRRWESVAGGSKGMFDSISAKIWAVEGVTDFRPYKNSSDVNDPNGQPAKSYTAFVIGGSDQEIAEAIYLQQDPLLNTVGDITKTVYTDLNPWGCDISFSRASNVEVLVKVSIDGLDKLDEATKTAIKRNIVSYTNGSLDSVGQYTFNYAGYRIGISADAGGLYLPVKATIEQTQFANDIFIEEILVARKEGTPTYDTIAKINRGEVAFVLETSVELVKA